MNKSHSKRSMRPFPYQNRVTESIYQNSNEPSVKSINDLSSSNSSNQSHSNDNSENLNMPLGNDYIHQSHSPRFQSKATLANGQMRSSRDPSQGSNRLSRQLSLRYTDSQDKANSSPARKRMNEVHFSGRKNWERSQQFEEAMGSYGEGSLILRASLKTSKSFENFKLKQEEERRKMEKMRRKVSKNYNPKRRYYRRADFALLDNKWIRIYQKDGKKNKGKRFDNQNVNSGRNKRRLRKAKKHPVTTQSKIRTSLPAPNIGQIFQHTQIPKHSKTNRMRTFTKNPSSKNFSIKPKNVATSGSFLRGSLNMESQPEHGPTNMDSPEMFPRGEAQIGRQDSRFRVKSIRMDGEMRKYSTPKKSQSKKRKMGKNKREEEEVENVIELGQARFMRNKTDFIQSSLGKEKFRLDVETKANLKTNSRENLENFQMSSDLLSNEKKIVATPKFGNSEAKFSKRKRESQSSSKRRKTRRIKEESKMITRETMEDSNESQLVDESTQNNEFMIMELSVENPKIVESSKKEEHEFIRDEFISSQNGLHDSENRPFKSDRSNETKGSVVTFKNANSTRDLNMTSKLDQMLMNGRPNATVFMKKAGSEHVLSIENTTKTLKHANRVETLEGRRILSGEYSVKRGTPLSQMTEMGEQGIRVSQYQETEDGVGPGKEEEGKAGTGGERKMSEDGPELGGILTEANGASLEIKNINNVFKNSKFQETIIDEAEEKTFSINSESSGNADAPSENLSKATSQLGKEHREKTPTASISEQSQKPGETFANSAQKPEKAELDSLRQADVIISSASQKRFGRLEEETRFDDFDRAELSDEDEFSIHEDSFEEGNSEIMLKRKIESR